MIVTKVSTDFFELRRPDLPWGDYGDILAHGMADYRGDKQWALDRTGPYVPPISQPSNKVVVNAEFRQLLEKSGLTGLDFAPVILGRVPEIDWLSWEPYGPKSMKYPAGNEPENYILRRKHSAKAAAAIGTLWELQLSEGITAHRLDRYRLDPASWTGADFFLVRGERASGNYVSKKARDWLTGMAGEWVAFGPVHIL